MICKIRKKWNQWSVLAVEVNGKALECGRGGHGVWVPSCLFSNSAVYIALEAHHINNSLKNTINFSLKQYSIKIVSVVHAPGYAVSILWL